MNQKGQGIPWEVILLIPIGMIVLYVMFFVAEPFLNLLFPLLDNTDLFPLGWLPKLIIQLLPLICVILLILRMKRTADYGGRYAVEER